MGSSVLDSKRQSLSEGYRGEIAALRIERQAREGTLALAVKSRQEAEAEKQAGRDSGTLLAASIRERFAAQDLINAQRREMQAAERLIQELEGEIDGSAERAA